MVGVGFVSGAIAQQATHPTRPVSTYSIVARDPATGQLGVAVQSHWFSVGAIVPWAEAGVGAVATQSFIEPSYGPLGLELMRMGRSAPDALKSLLLTDTGREVRQVAMIDAQGKVGVHTGNQCIAQAGNELGEDFSTQANMMATDRVWGAMAKAFRAGRGDLAERLLAALEAAESEGGDIRGRQSAAIVVVAGQSTGRPWKDRIFDLRVEDNPQPVKELRRLVRLQRAYLKLNEGDEAVTNGDTAAALAAYSDALSIVQDSETNGEAPFWVGVTLCGLNRVEEGIPYLRRAYRIEPRWAELLLRLPASGMLPKDDALLRRLVEQMK